MLIIPRKIHSRCHKHKLRIIPEGGLLTLQSSQPLLRILNLSNTRVSVFFRPREVSTLLGFVIMFHSYDHVSLFVS